MSKNAEVPDYERGPWNLQYTTDLYYDPDKDETEQIRFKERLSQTETRIRQRLLPYWYAKVYTYQHQSGKAGCHVYFVFNSDPVVIQWGLTGEKENWLTAVRFRGRWVMLTQKDSWSFDFKLCEGAARIGKFRLYLNDHKIAEY